MTTIHCITLACALYLFVMAFVCQTHNTTGTMLFKVIPFFIALWLISLVFDAHPKDNMFTTNSEAKTNVVKMNQ